MSTDHTFPRLPRTRRVSTAAVALLVVVGVVLAFANVLLVAWLGMVIAGILGVAVGYGTAVAVSFLGHLLIGLLRSR